MTDEEMKSAAGMVVDHGRITKLTGTLTGMNAECGGTGFTEVDLKFTVRGGVYTTGKPSLPSGWEITELVNITDLSDKVAKAQKSIERWSLPGVGGIGDINKAPKEIAKLMLGAMTRITMNDRIGRTLVQYTSELKELGATESAIEDNQSKSKFIAMLAYDAMNFESKDVEDKIISRNLATFRYLKKAKEGEGGLSFALKNMIYDIESDAVRRG